MRAVTRAEVLDLLEAVTGHIRLADLVAGQYQDMAPFDEFEDRHWALLVRFLSGEGFDDEGGAGVPALVPPPSDPGPRSGRHSDPTPPTPEELAAMDELENLIEANERESNEPLRLGGAFDGVTLP